jgi:predicted metal-dependent peptidase
MSLMSWTAPGFRHLFYKLLSNNNGKYSALPTRRIPTAATDAKNILINPDAFFKYPLKQRVFIMGHEIVHNVFGDVELLHRCAASGTVPMNDGTTLPFREGHMQHAMDYRINALLRDSRIGEPPPGCLLDDQIATADSSVLDTYKKLYEDDPDGGHGSGGFDLVLKPGSSTGQQPQPRNQQQWQIEVQVAQTLEQMRTQGKMAGALQRMFKEILQPHVPWTDHIKGIFNRRVGSGSYNWKRPDRRHIVRDLYMPSRSGHGAGWLAIWGDTSGSIGPDELNKYLAELGGIIEDVRPKRITVLWCDAAISHIDEISEVTDLFQIKCRGVGGGGGTEVIPVFDWIAEQMEVPDMFIGFTDGYVDFPAHRPAFDCIWASVVDEDKHFPWGEVVKINPPKH